MSAESTSNFPTSTKRASHIRNLFFWQQTEQITDAVVLITGAASGIAKQLAFIYAARGCKLSLCDYNQQGLLETLDECRKIRKMARPSQYISFGPGGSNNNNNTINMIQSDIPIINDTTNTTSTTTSTINTTTSTTTTQSLDNDPYIIGCHVDVTNEKQCHDWVNQAVIKFHDIHVLLLSAGIGAHNIFKDTDDLTMFRKCIDINYYGYLYCTHAAYPHLIRSRGVLTAITSFSGEVGLPYRTAYCASKFAVTGFLEALRAEMEDISSDDKFDIVIVCPPTTNTNLRQNSLTTDQTLKHDTNPGISVDDCAACIVDATDRRLRKAFFPLGSAIASYARPLIPDYIDKKIWSKARL